MLAAGCAALVSATSATASRTCGTVSSSSGAAHVRVDRGTTSCRSARSLLRDYFAGRGVRHTGSSQATRYTKIRGWKCPFNHGGGDYTLYVYCTARGNTVSATVD